MTPAPDSGDVLRAALIEDHTPVEVARLVEQAARAADRLNRLRDLIEGDGETWAHLRFPRSATEEPTLILRIDGALSEERQQANLLRQLMSEIHRQRTAYGLISGEEDDIDPAAGMGDE